MAGTTISDLGKLLAQNTQSVQGTDNTTRSTNAKVDFGTMMRQTNNRQTAAYADVNHNETIKTAASGKDTNTVSDNYQKYQYKDNTIASETKQVTSDDTVKEQLEQFTKDVKEVLKEELGVTDEAIEAAMQTLGLQFQDLLNQNNLANLVAELTGADSVQQLLCSEQFVNVLQSVNDIGKDVLNALGMNVEEFQKAVALAVFMKNVITGSCDIACLSCCRRCHFHNDIFTNQIICRRSLNRALHTKL
jgi:flagellar hook-length control protein FliK